MEENQLNNSMSQGVQGGFTICMSANKANLNLPSLHGSVASQNMLRDRLVCGISNERLQCQLHCEKDLTFAKPFELCQIHESAESNAKLLNKPEPIHVASNHHTDRLCYCCRENHLVSNCQTQCNFKEHIV